MDIYNAASYELIPYRPFPGAPKVGTPFALLRFRLVDLWIMRVLMHLQIVNVDYAKNIIGEILADYEEIIDFYGKAVAAETNPELLLPISAYIGKFVDPDRAKKREALLVTGLHYDPPYFPARSSS